MENFIRVSLTPLTFVFSPPKLCRWEMNNWIMKTFNDLQISFNILTMSDEFKNLHILEKSEIFKMYREAEDILCFFKKSYTF